MGRRMIWPGKSDSCAPNSKLGTNIRRRPLRQAIRKRCCCHSWWPCWKTRANPILIN